MNRIFRKVWSRSLQRVVIASELASGDSVGAVDGSANSTRRRPNFLALAVFASLYAWAGGAALAGDVCTQTGDGTAAIAIGTSTFACGNGAVANQPDSTAVGSSAQATGSSSTAFGANAEASRIDATAIGFSASSTGDGATAVGANTVASGVEATALGNVAQASGDFSTAVGGGSIASGFNSSVFGNFATASGQDSLALGSDSEAAALNAVALGAGSVADRDNTVSIGSAGNERQITNVAAGTEATDAVNVEQLDAVAVEASRYFKADGAADGSDDARVSGENGVAAGANAEASGIEATALGNIAQASGDFSTAVGSSAIASGLNSSVFGNLATASAQDSVALGAGSVADRDNTVSIGSAGNERQITNVAAGTEATDAVNLEQLDAVAVEASRYFKADGAADGSDDAMVSGENGVAAGANAEASRIDTTAIGFSASSTGDGATAVGANTVASGVEATALGNVAQASGDFSTAVGGGSIASGFNSSVFGNFATASGQDSLALGSDSEAAALNAVALGAGSVADRDNTVSIGSAGNERQITNVAAGTEGTDAVNLDQLDAVASDVGELAQGAVQYDDDSKSSISLAGDSGTLVTNVAAGELSAESSDAVNGGQLFATNARVTVVEERVDGLDDRVDDIEGGVANAVQYDDETKNSVTLEGSAGTVLGNVAAGQVDASSMQAINGAQLFQVADSVAQAFGGGASVTAFGTINAPSYIVQGGSYFNVGDALSALDAGLVGIDNRVTALELQTVNVGEGEPGVAIDGDVAAEVAEGSGAVAVGSGAKAGGSNGTAVGGDAYAHGANDTAVGGGAHVGADGSTALGANSNVSADASNAVAVGESASVSAASGTAIGQGAAVTADGAVALGAGSIADRENTVSVGSAGDERQVTNVAAGTSTTDAVNKGQLDAGVTEAKTYADTTATQAVTTANAYTDMKFSAVQDSFGVFQEDVSRRLDGMDRRIDRQGAMGAAMLNMATSAAGIRTPNRVGVGVGFQGGESAISAGYQRAFSDRAVMTIGGASSGNDTSVGVGAGFGW